jgi:hypothetical protein
MEMEIAKGKVGLLLVVLVIAGLTLAGCASGQARPPQTQGEVPRMAPAELKSKIDGGDPILIVDSRSAGEFAKMHIPGAISVTLSETEARLNEFPRDREIVFYCT